MSITVRRSGMLDAAIFDALSAHIVIINEQGTIVKTNRAWRRFGRDNRLESPRSGVGENYFSVCSAAGDDPVACRAAAGIRSLLTGHRKSFRLTYPCHGAGKRRYFQMRGHSFYHAGALHVLLVHESVTELVQARNEKAKKAKVLKRINEKLVRLSQKVLFAQEEERRVISRDIHDTFSQRIACLRLMLSGLPDKAEEEREQLLKVLDSDIARLADDIRMISHRLHPSILRDQGLLGAIRQEIYLAKADRNIDIELKACSLPADLPADLATCVYRILQEALTNAIKHSGAQKITIDVNFDKGKIVLKVSDDGRGFSEASSGTKGIGLNSMRERAELMSGKLLLRSLPGAGTCIEVYVPWRRTRKP